MNHIKTPSCAAATLVFRALTWSLRLSLCLSFCLSFGLAGSVLAQAPTKALTIAPTSTSGSAQHNLFGKWELVWLDTMASNDVTINEVKGQATYTDAFGTIKSGSEQCKFELTVVDNVKTIIARPGPPALPDAMVVVPAWVGIRITCNGSKVFGNGLGGGSAQAAIVGRALVNVTNQPAQDRPWAMSRPQTAPAAATPK